MKSFGIEARGMFRRLWMLLAAVIVIAVGTAFWANARSTESSLNMPSTGVVIVTGYGTSSPENPSTQPRSVVLTDSQAAALRRQLSEIPTLKQSAGPIICMENAAVFRIAIKGVDSPSRTVWVAQAELSGHPLRPWQECRKPRSRQVLHPEGAVALHLSQGNCELDPQGAAFLLSAALAGAILVVSRRHGLSRFTQGASDWWQIC